jgi:class 3 adenylate cyclase
VRRDLRVAIVVIRRFAPENSRGARQGRQEATVSAETGFAVDPITAWVTERPDVFVCYSRRDRDADLSDFIEVTFTVSPEVRRSRYHDPWSLTPEEHFFRYRFTQTGVVDGQPLREHLRRCAVVCAYLEPGATETFTATAERGYLWFTNGPALIVGDARTSECRSFAFEYTGTHSQGFRATIAAGPVEIEFTNATDERYALMMISFSSDFHVTMQPFLSGAALLSNQTFLDLFVTETLVAGEGLAVKRLALLFTDLQGSTALYERIGDLKAFDLVRLHFAHLRECIARNSGALVKTIGDAVMASFVDPLDALRAALDMRTQIAEFNAGAGSNLISLKIGLHAGACLAVTLNDRLDYFGQTVNIAARVQGLAGADEIVVTDYVLSLPRAAELVAGLELESSAAQLKGIAGDVAVHRLRGAAVGARASAVTHAR